MRRQLTFRKLTRSGDMQGLFEPSKSGATDCGVCRCLYLYKLQVKPAQARRQAHFRKWNDQNIEHAPVYRADIALYITLATSYSAMTLTIDFFADWKAHMLGDIASQGYQVASSEPLDSISYKFFNLRRRRLQARSRNIHESSEFRCPSDHSNGYQSLKAKLVVGEDVTPHLSKSLLDVNYDDPLLNDWGIHHFHLGKTVEAPDFVDRTGPLLFAFVTPDDVYCINVFPHGAWTEQELVKILHRNWPAAIGDFKLNGVLGLSHSFSNQDIAKLRKAGVQTMVEVGPGVVYAPMGGGYSTAGTSVRATMQSDNYRRIVRSLEAHVRENLQMFLGKIAEYGLAPASPPAFSLLVNDEGFFALETGSKVAFMLHPHNRG